MPSGRCAALRLTLHAFLAAGMAPEALDVLTGVCLGGEPPSLSALASLLHLLFHGGEVRAAWKVFEERKCPRGGLGRASPPSMP